MTTDESNIRSQTKEDTHKRTTASPTSLRQETNDKKSKKNDQVQVTKMIGIEDNIEKNTTESTNMYSPVVPPQNKDETATKKVPAISTTSIAKEPIGERRKENDLLQGSKLVSVQCEKLSQNKNHITNADVLIGIRNDDQSITDCADVIPNNDITTAASNKVNVAVDLTKKNDANIVMGKLLNERKNIVQEWSMFLDSQYDSSTINSAAAASRITNTTRKETDSTQQSIGKALPKPPPGRTLVIPPSARIAGGSFSKIYTEDIRKSLQNKKTLRPQKSLSKCSALLCPNLYLYEHYTLGEKQKKYSNEHGPFGLCKIIQVPNGKKM